MKYIFNWFHFLKVGVDGDRITVTCKVAGNPKPEVTWFKNKQAIKKSKDFAIEFNGEVAKLTINDAYPEDTGDYTCEVWNELGQQTAPFKITIKGVYLLLVLIYLMI